MIDQDEAARSAGEGGKRSSRVRVRVRVNDRVITVKPRLCDIPLRTFRASVRDRFRHAPWLHWLLLRLPLPAGTAIRVRVRSVVGTGFRHEILSPQGPNVKVGIRVRVSTSACVKNKEG